MKRPLSWQQKAYRIHCQCLSYLAYLASFAFLCSSNNLYEITLLDVHPLPDGVAVLVELIVFPLLAGTLQDSRLANTAQTSHWLK